LYHNNICFDDIYIQFGIIANSFFLIFTGNTPITIGIE